MDKITIPVESETHTISYTFYVEDKVITDVYLRTKAKNSRNGFADFVKLEFVPEDVKKAVDVLLEEVN